MTSEEAKKYNKERYEKNKEKLQAQARLWKEKNAVKNKETKKNWYNKNKNKSIVRNKEWCENNKEKRREQQASYKKERRQTDLLFRLSSNMRNVMNIAFKRNSFYKKSKTRDILGCSFEEFKIHLESKFEPWMNWNNHGLYNGTEGYGWDIDHKVPLSSAKTEEELIKLLHHSNLQPLCSYVNRNIKKNKMSSV